MGRLGWVAPGRSSRVGRPGLGRLGGSLVLVFPGGSPMEGRWRPTWEHPDRQTDKQIDRQGGPLAGSIWTLIPTQWEYFTSSHFVMASQKRLATVTVQEGFFCQLTEGFHTTNRGNVVQYLTVGLSIRALLAIRDLLKIGSTTTSTYR